MAVVAFDAAYIISQFTVETLTLTKCKLEQIQAQSTIRFGVFLRPSQVDFSVTISKRWGPPADIFRGKKF